ncbi:MAG TPA: MgtC/SapB family protein [Abditibacteriaceae bacterium]|jgi:putative Mg2+ transporter-C (MgtC) family protein
MQALLDALQQELLYQMPNTLQFVRVTLRLVMAALIAGVIGWEREGEGKAAGLRTHMLVSLGSALFVLSALESGARPEDVTRVTQGITAGIGFIGGGVILKLTEERRVHGLTTAATIWLAAALGVAAGLGRVGAAVVGLLCAWVILRVLLQVEKRLDINQPESKHDNA